MYFNTDMYLKYKYLSFKTIDLKNNMTYTGLSLQGNMVVVRLFKLS